ncbi:MAG TPA: FAD-dependent oxidoreductase, partial [Xanthobacteraceae bacterium]|nr:FAD-dependent oxidoreductase [Xanthobacteraceae bacterium]
MARSDAIVLGAGIVGTSIALHLAKRGLCVALVDRRAPGEETSYGNAGVIEGNTIFPPAFPSDPIALLRVALKRAPEANYHLSFLPQVVPWLMQFRAASQPQRLIETARLMRPLFARALAEHETLLAESGATRFLRKQGWLKLYRGERAFDALKGELALAQEFGIPYRALDTDAARELEPSLAPVFRHAVHWQGVASVTD